MLIVWTVLMGLVIVIGTGRRLLINQGGEHFWKVSRNCDDVTMSWGSFLLSLVCLYLTYIAWQPLTKAPWKLKPNKKKEEHNDSFNPIIQFKENLGAERKHDRKSGPCPYRDEKKRERKKIKKRRKKELKKTLRKHEQDMQFFEKSRSSSKSRGSSLEPDGQIMERSMSHSESSLHIISESESTHSDDVEIFSSIAADTKE